MSKKQSDTPGGNGITFLVTNNPLASSAANKRRVRSVAALRSWPDRRKKTFEQSQSKAYANQGGFVLDLSEPPPAPARKRKRETPAAASESSSELKTFSFVNVAAEPSNRQPAPVVVDEEPLFEKCSRAVDSECACSHCTAERKQYGHSRPSLLSSRKRSADGNLKASEGRGAVLLAPPTPSPSPHQPSPLTVLHSSKAEPFGQYPVEYHPWFDHVLHHMMHVFAPRGWPALKISNEQGLRWEWFMTQHALAEPALFYVRLLFATGDLVRLETLQPRVSYWLQNKAVQAINEALSDPQRATSDAIILAVGRIALHESLYGDRAAANAVHRPAQKRMIGLRGGMKELPFPDLVKRLMRWADTVMAKQSGTERMLEDEEECANFSMEQHVEVLEEWVPAEGQDLRRKISIADLLWHDPSEPP